MLENSQLRIDLAGAEFSTWKFRDPDSSQILGRVRSGPPGGWWGRDCWEVVETEDEALVFTMFAPNWLHRPWSFVDAENHCLGWWRENAVCNGVGERLAHFQALEEGMRFVDVTGLKLVQAFLSGPKCCHLVFGPVASPFTRMALLGGVLIWIMSNHRPD